MLILLMRKSVYQYTKLNNYRYKHHKCPEANSEESEFYLYMWKIFVLYIIDVAEIRSLSSVKKLRSGNYTVNYH